MTATPHTTFPHKIRRRRTMRNQKYVLCEIFACTSLRIILNFGSLICNSMQPLLSSTIKVRDRSTACSSIPNEQNLQWRRLCLITTPPFFQANQVYLIFEYIPMLLGREIRRRNPTALANIDMGQNGSSCLKKNEVAKVYIALSLFQLQSICFLLFIHWF